jgi:hypothetical protein
VSLRVLAIPEDFVHDEVLLRPFIQRACAEAGHANAIVEVCKSPRFGGVRESLKPERIRDEVVARYRGMVDYFIQVIDADGQAIGRQRSLDQGEKAVRPLLGSARYIGVVAVQEVEAWILAGCPVFRDRWRAIREEVQVKERHYLPFARKEQVLEAPAQGRGILARRACQEWRRVQTLCTEVGALVEALRTQDFPAGDAGS